MGTTGCRDVWVTAAVAILTIATLSLPIRAATRIAISPGLMEAGLLCVAEAQRLCPDVLKAKDYGLSCLKNKRHLLSSPCRGVYDQGASLLKGGDVQLKPPKAIVPPPDVSR